MLKKVFMFLTAVCCLIAAGCARNSAVVDKAGGIDTPPAVVAHQSSANGLVGADVGAANIVLSRIATEDVTGKQGAGIIQQEVVAVPEKTAEVLELKRIYFDFDSYLLTQAARETLADSAQRLIKGEGSLRVVIEGHCDEAGSDEYNMALGEKRAKAAANYLVSLGVSSSRLDIVSYGEERPVATGPDESARAQNRRAEFKVAR